MGKEGKLRPRKPGASFKSGDDIVTTGNLHRANDANFAHSVGAQVPGSVRIYGVPQSIVDIVPQYRGFDYIIVGNDHLIVDPSTLQIDYIDGLWQPCP